MLKLHSFYRSSAAYRVRIALNLKGLPYEYVPVHMLNAGGEHKRDDYRAFNPQALIPTLIDGGAAFAQTIAIIEYLEETRPEPPLLPADPAERARVRAFAQFIACEIHPLLNLRVLNYLRDAFGLGDSQRRVTWYHHWIAEGLGALEADLARTARRGDFCFGDRPGLAECFLVPQLFNARRFNCDLAPYPTLVRIDAACRALAPFAEAAPERQPDAE